MTSPKRICHILEMNTQHLLCMRKRINQTNNNPWCKTCQVYHMNRWSVCIQSWGQHSVSANEWERVSGDQADYQEIYACRFLLLGLPTVCTTARNLQCPKWDNHLYQIYNFPMMFTSRYGWCKQLGGQGAAQDRDVPHTDVMWMSCWWRSYVSLQRCKREEKIKYQKNKKNMKSQKNFSTKIEDGVMLQLVCLDHTTEFAAKHLQQQAFRHPKWPEFLLRIARCNSLHDILSLWDKLHDFTRACMYVYSI